MTEARKIAAILVADVVGYSRLTGADEEGTLRRLRELRAELFNPAVALHAGRVVKRTGDGVIVEFRSVVEAVRCALDVTRGLAERNAGLPAELRIEVRTGIHLGDVIEEPDGDLLGDGVNIAARLEGLCEPGGIYLSEDAWRQVRDRIPEPFVDLGERELKNIIRPMRVYELGGPSDPPGAQVLATGPATDLTPARTVPGAVAGVLQSVARLTDAYADGPANRSEPRRDRRRRTVEILRNVERIVDAEVQRARRYRANARSTPLAIGDPRPAERPPAGYSAPAPLPRTRPHKFRFPIIATAIILVLATRACHDFSGAPPQPPAPPPSATAR